VTRPRQPSTDIPREIDLAAERDCASLAASLSAALIVEGRALAVNVSITVLQMKSAHNSARIRPRCRLFVRFCLPLGEFSSPARKINRRNGPALTSESWRLRALPGAFHESTGKTCG
jgi:hypothetical protein